VQNQRSIDSDVTFSADVFRAQAFVFVVTLFWSSPSSAPHCSVESDSNGQAHSFLLCNSVRPFRIYAHNNLIAGTVLIDWLYAECAIRVEALCSNANELAHDLMLGERNWLSVTGATTRRW